MYKAEHPSLALKVYCLKYEASLETDRYVAALHQEQAAFENLIAAKGHMVCQPWPVIPILTSFGRLLCCRAHLHN